jgi:hypothetical protein
MLVMTAMAPSLSVPTMRPAKASAFRWSIFRICMSFLPS